MEFCNWTERAIKPSVVALWLRRGVKYEDI